MSWLKENWFKVAIILLVIWIVSLMADGQIQI